MKPANHVSACERGSNTIRIKARKGLNPHLFPLNLKPSAHIHIMGIGGTAMSNLAGILKKKGYRLQGSDKNFYPPSGDQLKKLHIPLLKGYPAKNIHSGLDLVIVGNVISKHFPSAQALLHSQIPYISLPEALNQFVLKDKKSIMVCGTHGKTTISCLSAHVLKECGLDPGFMVGGVAENFKTGFHLSNGPWFVLEGDEYDTAFFEKSPKFIHYHANYVLLNNIEFDHADIYPNKSAVVQAFKLLIQKATETGTFLIANAECPETAKLTDPVQNKITYGLKKGDWQMVNRTPKQSAGQTLLVENKQKQERAEIHIPLAGEHNALNALSVWAMTSCIGINPEKVSLAFKSFLGTKRRFQVLGTFAGRTLIEDFAHHPTAVRAVLRSVKEMYPGRRVVAVFEPRSNTSQRNIFQTQYEKSLSIADVIFCRSAHSLANLPEKDRFSAKTLTTNIKKQGGMAYYLENVADMAELIRQKTAPKDIIIIMSNGDFGGLIPLLKTTLSHDKLKDPQK